ncbi:MAG TPA: CDP-alcohol phosphatidyltransferase family protein [Candidatus Acidoferrales bacterium]|nr:CDP-alcohol phosphatidyltransferase family protein [Candidatus Acidoferrales bacterium]
MAGRTAGRILRFLPEGAVQILARTRVHPNLLSALGLAASLSAAASFAAGRFAPAGVAMLAAGALDWLDGAVARAQGRATCFGAFLDSSLDCYGDLVLFVGLLVYYARVNRFLYAVLVCFALAGSVMIGYARARSASLVARGQPQPVAGLERGFWERPERLGLMIVGALINRMAPVLWLLAIGPNLGVVGTILRARRKIRLLARQPAAETSQSF